MPYSPDQTESGPISLEQFGNSLMFYLASDTSKESALQAYRDRGHTLSAILTSDFRMFVSDKAYPAIELRDGERAVMINWLGDIPAVNKQKLMGIIGIPKDGSEELVATYLDKLKEKFKAFING